MDSEKAAVLDREFVFLAAFGSVVLLKRGGASKRGKTLAITLCNKHFQECTEAEDFREHHYQVSLLYKTEKKSCTEVRPMQTTLCKTEFHKTRTPTRHLLPAHQKCDKEIWDLCSFSFSPLWFEDVYIFCIHYCS